MSEQGAWVRAASVDDVPNGHAYDTGVEANGEIIGLFCLDGQYFALGECSHEQAPLCQGLIEGSQVTCPWHSARFDIRSGECLAGPSACRTNGDVTEGGAPHSGPDISACRTYSTKVEGNDIYVLIP